VSFDSYLWQTVQKKQEFIAQIMSSKSPVRSCDDVDETALSYAEIKALCAGNPLIAEKMALDNDVAKLRMLQSEYRSQRYRLEDNLLKKYPEQITAVTERIAGIETDIKNYTAEKEKHVEITTINGAASVSVKFPGMTVNGVSHSEKEPAAKALLDACKGIKDRNSDLPIGEYMGFDMSLRYESYGSQINLLLRGAMTYQIDLGTDSLGNITRINNALDGLTKRLEGAREQLAGYEKQAAAAKEELEKPFPQEAELREKEARLALLNADLNIDGNGGLDVLNDTESREEKAEPEGEIDEPEAECDDDDDEPEYQEGAVSPFTPAIPGAAAHGRGYEDEPLRTGTYDKKPPSILDDIRNISNGLKPPAQGGGKSAEINI
jgi:hypothetical protein